MKRFASFCYSTIFWGWNLTFLLFIYAGILPLVTVPLMEDAIAGTVPPSILVSLAALVLVPTLCTLMAILRWRNQSVRLIRLFYGVEAPLFALCLLRLFILRELTPATTLLLGTVVLCILAFAVELVTGYAAQRRSLAWVQLIQHSLMLITAVYVGVLLTFYVVPASCIFIYQFFQFHWLSHLFYLLTTHVDVLFWGTISLLLFSVSCTLFFAMPFVMVKLYFQSWWRIWTAFGKQHSSQAAIAGTAGVVLCWCFLFTMLQTQPQVQVFEWLKQPATTAEARQTLLARSPRIREGLVNAYLSSYRYLSPWEESNQLREMYRFVFNLPQEQAQFWQDFHNHWLSPFLYRGSRGDREQAAALYAQFFDVPLQKAERQAIRQALEATTNRDETQAGLLNIDDRVVHLAQQQVMVREEGDWAEIELYEQYRNPTLQEQEIFYSFSLPESAVITGLWLGDRMDRQNRFRFTVSPRGAAQQVYTGEVERANVTVPDDPALLEQVGPRQYRLRVFPIPAAESRQKPGELHLWLTYRVMQQELGWPLPQLTEKRNIFWTADTVRLRNDRPITLEDDRWLEGSLPLSQRSTPRVHQVTLPEGYRVTATPFPARNYQMPRQQHIALIVDGSYSMTAQRQQVVNSMQWLNQYAASNDVDLYLTASAGATPQRIDDVSQFNPDSLTFYGSLQLPEMVAQFAQLQEATAYDAILLLTDEGSYELEQDTPVQVTLTAPFWAIHLGGRFPRAYADATLQLLQHTKGGIAASLPEALQRLTTEAALGGAIASVSDGYAWSVDAVDGSSESRDTAQAAREEGVLVASASTAIADVGTSLLAADPGSSPPEDGFVPLAARQLILKLSREQDITQLASLDRVHTIAKRTEIVTPYSSMLVLVNDRQRELLRQAEANRDRFNRKVEDGQDDLSQPGNPLNAVSVPEPAGLVGMGVMAIALVGLRKRGR